MKRCNKCKKLKDENDFYKNRATKSGLNGSCKECVKSYQRDNKERIRRNAKRFRMKNPNYSRDQYFKLKKKFHDMYGNRCLCCGETMEEFLTLDHINGQIGKKRDHSSKAYKNATDTYNPSKYRILCMNCNHSIGMRGYCPHANLDKE